MSWDPVYQVVKQIPRGRVTTYGALARALRLRGGARTAGRAMAATPSGKGIPWHRVVGDHGKLLIPEPYGIPPTKIVAERRHPTGGIPCGLEEAPLVAERGREAARETESAAGA